MDRIPHEILEQVFYRCLIFERTGIYAAVSNYRAPLLFLTVCKRWQEIALSTPVLWISMCLTYPRRFLGPSDVARNTDESVAAAEGIRAWLSRARHLPICLFIREDYDPQRRVAGSSGAFDASRRRIIVEVSNAIGEFSGTCADLDVDVSPLSFQALCLNGQGGWRPFPTLRSLSIGSSHSPWGEVWDTNTAQDLPLFSVDTHLQSLSLSTSYLPVNLLLVPASFESLVELTLTYRLETDLFRPSPLLVFQILWRCRNLTACTLTLGEAQEAFAFEPKRGRLELPSLRTFTIFDECPTTTLSLMSALYVPSLERLRYSHCTASVSDLPFNAAHEPLLPIQSLQLRLDETSPSPLVELALRLITDDDDDDDDEPSISDAIYSYLVREGESIRDLHVSEASVEITELLLLSHNTDEFDDGELTLTPTSNTSALCPGLQSIVWSSYGESTQEFIKVLRQRCDANMTLPHLALQRAQLLFWELTQLGAETIEGELEEIAASAASELTMEYEIYWWKGAPCEGQVESKRGVVRSVP